MSSYRAAFREAHRIVPDTCPHVDDALAKAAELIKQQTGNLRDALIEALESKMQAEETIVDLEREIERLKSELDYARSELLP